MALIAGMIVVFVASVALMVLGGPLRGALVAAVGPPREVDTPQAKTRLAQIERKLRNLFSFGFLLFASGCIAGTVIFARQHEVTLHVSTRLAGLERTVAAQKEYLGWGILGGSDGAGTRQQIQITLYEYYMLRAKAEAINRSALWAIKVPK